MSGPRPEQVDETTAPELDLAAEFQVRIRATLREILDFDGRSTVDIAAAAWPELDRAAAGQKLNRLTRAMDAERSWTTFECHHAAALAEALGVDPGDFYAAP